MKETELNKVLNYMKQYVENKYEHDSEPMLTYKDLQLVLEEIERLNNIINETREYLTNNAIFDINDKGVNKTMLSMLRGDKE